MVKLPHSSIYFYMNESLLISKLIQSYLKDNGSLSINIKHDDLGEGGK